MLKYFRLNDRSPFTNFSPEIPQNYPSGSHIPDTTVFQVFKREMEPPERMAGGEHPNARRLTIRPFWR